MSHGRSAGSSGVSHGGRKKGETLGVPEVRGDGHLDPQGDISSWSRHCRSAPSLSLSEQRTWRAERGASGGRPALLPLGVSKKSKSWGSGGHCRRQLGLSHVVVPQIRGWGSPAMGNGRVYTGGKNWGGFQRG